MSEIVEKLVRPTVEMLDHMARKIPQALGKAHYRISKMAHDAADHFDKVEEDVAGKAHIHTHDGEEHLPGEGGLANSAASRAEAAAKDGGKAAEDAERDAARDAEHDANLRSGNTDKDSIPAGERTCKTDPVDVVTGDMVLPQVDVRLPGALPLVLERIHVSSYRHGVWFGPSWASTLDQRLQLDAEGVVFAAADGARLVYPIPRGDAAVYPLKGPRRPLTWSGEPNTPIRIGDPGTGQTLVFDHPRPAPGAVGGVSLRLVAVEDRCGRRIEVTWSDDDTPVLLTHHGGYRIAIDRHPALPRITAFRLLDTDGPGTETVLMRYGYDSAGNLTEIINSSGLPLRLTYDPQGRVTGWTDRNGTAYRYVYDDAGRVIETAGSDNFLSSSFAYDESTRTTSFTNSLGHTTTYQHNDAYRLVSETSPLGEITVQEWDGAGRLLTSVTDPLGRTTRYEYDDEENVTAIVRPDGTRASAVHNELSLPVEATEPDGLRWRHTYDTRGNRLSTSDTAGAVTRYAYDEAGDLISVTDALGNTQQFRYDAAGLPIETIDALGRVTTAERDAFGRVRTLTDPLGGVHCFGWTTEGNPAWYEHPDGTRESWEWDAEGNELSHTDTAGHVTSSAYTHFDLPSERTTVDGTRYRFAYDTELRLTGVTNPQGLTWHYAYDPAGRLVSETDFNGRTLAYRHDAAGQLVARTNAAEETIIFVRDEVGMVVEQRSGDEVTRFQRDPAGRLLHAVNAHCELNRTYDEARRLVAETVGGRTMTYAYDVLGRLVERRTPSGIVSRWSFDAEGYPEALTTGGQTVGFAFDANGRETTRRYGADLMLTQSWNASDRLTAQSVGVSGEAGGGLVQHREYHYRADGFLTEIQDLLAGTRRYELDAGGRPRRALGHQWTETYAYDNLGNLTRAAAPVGDGQEEEREFAGTLLRRTTRTVYEHDAQGRVVRTTKRLLNGQTRIWHYTWNAEDQLTQTVTPDGVRWRYLYDPAGRRIAKQRMAQDGSVAEEIRFTWDGARLAEQTAPDGASTAWEYLLDSHRPLAQIDQTNAGDGELSQAEVDARFHAIITDLTGAPRELVTLDGELAWQQSTTVWGVTTQQRTAGAVDCPLRFPGQYADEETGWNYNFFRHYDPETARYTSPDPLGLAPAPNQFAYVGNPFSWSDPLGLAACQDQYAWDGSVKYGKLDELGRPTGISASIRPEMLDKGSEAGRLMPRGWRGDGTAFNEARGHLLANRLGGVGKGRLARHNLVTLTQDPVNTPLMRDNFEQKVYDAVKKGEIVQYHVTPIYEGANPIPVRLEFLAHGNRGFHLSGHLENPASGVRIPVPR
ncbi:DUF6531 domain-containing protein [Streptomyces sp. RB6PN25]|uniref:DUF6531 domain-containing protein n=1 Tax=Streptomyces humicola TaxID=2953240 RepID=A0ABT1Q356_9ACTN|nr:DUF6531 domain-containing protein [Streptomyces humicola]MCQ4084359.1 DUF6531 domain-containing protein [Streptomyces humicola]